MTVEKRSRPTRLREIRYAMDDSVIAGYSARLATDRATAQRLGDELGETTSDADIAVAAFEVTDGVWALALYFQKPPNETAVRALIGMHAGAEAANALVFERVEAKDWVATSLEGLKPVEAGRFAVHGRHDRGRIRPNRIGIEIEAALAFGTGHHGTTRGCLLALDFIAKQRRPRKILDVGTGTGVLAIAAAKAFKTQVLASDIDDRAIMVARENARLNGSASLVMFIHAAGLADRRFRRHGPVDLVLANILLGPLIRMARPMRGLLAPGGRVVLSGLLHEQAQAALTAYRAQGLVLERLIRLDEWTTLVMRRPCIAALGRGP
jgi:ribosomal protein L11 methyltransferase